MKKETTFAVNAPESNPRRSNAATVLEHITDNAKDKREDPVEAKAYHRPARQLKANQNIYWLLGGIYKKGDKFNLSKKYFNKIKAFIYGKNKKFFNKKLKGKIKFENFHDLNDALKNIFLLIKKKN